MNKPRIALFGATGFLGAHIGRALAAGGYTVRAIHRGTSPRWHVQDLDAEWTEADLNDPPTLTRALEGCPGVVHAAGFYPRDGLDIDAARRQGVRQMRALLDACQAHGVKRLVYVSSPATLGLGPHRDAVLDETHFYTPGEVSNAYYEAKYAMEAEIYRYIEGGLPIIPVVPGAVFGPGDVKPTTGEFILRLARRRLPGYVGGVFNAVDVRDVASSIVAAMERGRPGRRYILGGTDLTHGEFVEMVATQAGVVAPPLRLPGAPVQQAARLAEGLGRALGLDTPPWTIGVELAVQGRRLDSTRARGELGHQPRPLVETIGATLNWFKKNGYL